MKLDIGCGPFKKEGYVGMDRLAVRGVDIVHDLERTPWPDRSDGSEILQSPIRSGSVSEVRAVHVLEHVHNLVPVLEEIHRVLRPGGVLDVEVPYFRSEGAFRDPTHVRYFTKNTFRYFEPGSEWAYISTARFRTIERSVVRAVPFEWHVKRHAPGIAAFLQRLPFGPIAALRFRLEAVKP